MKKKGRTSRHASPIQKGTGYTQLVTAISSLNSQMTGRVASMANQALVLRNWMIGAWIVEYEQNGADRAKYGVELLPKLAGDLQARGVKGLSISMLERCRRFYQISPPLNDTIPSTVFTELSVPGGAKQIPSTVLTEFETGKPSPAPLKSGDVLRLSWSQWIELIRIEDPWKRAFYENECLSGHWSVRQLQRQIESLLYERTGLSSVERRAA